MAVFTVDTHLFRELGELLVGRDSTALVELIKNAYDADATVVSVVGKNLGRRGSGRIIITDDGIGMTPDIFRRGFLRIASRIKESGNRRSAYYRRRFTGAKGVGRLAAHKLAKHMTIRSVPEPAVFDANVSGVNAKIDWARIESFETLDAEGISDAISVTDEDDDSPGTVIELTRLRGKWTAPERVRVIRELSTFLPAAALVELPKGVCKDDLLFETPTIRDISNEDADPGFKVELLGDFDVGEDYWSAVAQASDWILEISVDRREKAVEYCITPTRQCRRDLPKAEQHTFRWVRPSLESIPSLKCRVLIREGSKGIKKSQRRWLVDSAGIKVYMEGFRVLPYGEPGDDWLEIDYDYTQRSRVLRFLDETDVALPQLEGDDADAGLTALRNQSYFGAVFLTQAGTPELDMLVNREGFIPNSGFIALQRIIRVGVDLSVRVRAFENRAKREQRRKQRQGGSGDSDDAPPQRKQAREDAEEAARKASELAREAKQAAVAGQHAQAQKLIVSAAKEVERSSGLTAEMVSDRPIMQILAGVGLQMSAFVHEMNGLLGMTKAVEDALESLRERVELDRNTARHLSRVRQSVGDLRRVIERQASYLTDITSPDARRRRSRQRLAERFDASCRLVKRAAEKRGIQIHNRIPTELKSPPMFPAELLVTFSNLLTNAIKACRRNGRVRASGRARRNDVVIRIENTGQRVQLNDAEKWFLPFKSTSVEADPVLGQGMGMGLPIVRNILEEYGATISFVKPSQGFATAVEIVFA